VASAARAHTPLAHASGPAPPGSCRRQRGLLFSSRTFKVCSPFFTRVARSQVWSSRVTLEPVTSRVSPCLTMKSCWRGNQGGPRFTVISPASVFRPRLGSACPGRLAIPSCHNFPGSPPVPSLSSASGDRTLEVLTFCASTASAAPMETILLRRRTPREFHKDGENYEIGQSKHPGRREYDLAIKLPEEPKLLNKIKRLCP